MEVLELIMQKREDILRIAERSGARNVRLFGSTARGDAQESSDIDLLVELGSGFTLLKRARLVEELENLLGRKVDLVSDRALRDRIRDRILKEAKPL